jgi:hypothetical protein
MYRLHGVTARNIKLSIVAAVRASNPALMPVESKEGLILLMY